MSSFDAARLDAIKRLYGSADPATLGATAVTLALEVETLRARVAELEAERARERQSVPYVLGAEAMRERAGTLCEVAGELLGMGGDDGARTVLRNLAAKVRSLPLTDDAREDGGSDGE